MWTRLGAEKGLRISDAHLACLGCRTQGHQRLKCGQVNQFEQKPHAGAGALEVRVSMWMEEQLYFVCFLPPPHSKYPLGTKLLRWEGGGGQHLPVPDP